MKTLFQKELREHFKLAVIGAVILSFFLGLIYRDSSMAFRQVAEGTLQLLQMNNPQPLLAGDTIVTVVAFCAIFGAVLGWMQIHSERHRDLWAFLVHRPITRTEIFFGKALAGLCLYAFAAGLPLLTFIILVRWPGHFAVPFESAMTLPILTGFLSGTIFYFAGLLTGVRQARWFASRGLGVVASIMMTIMAVAAPFFGLALLLIFISAAIMAAAACGSFNSHGFYEGQPATNRRALVITLMLGCFVVLAVAAAFLSKPFDQWTSERTDYQITTDGTIYKVTSRYSSRTAGAGINDQITITDLNGVVLKDKKTGLPITQRDFSGRLTVQTFAVPLNSNAEHQARDFHSQDNFFIRWRQTRDTLWYLGRNGRLWAYDIASRRFIGSLGPAGFAPGLSYGSDRFNPPAGVTSSVGTFGQGGPTRTLTADSNVYKFDLENRACEVLFASANDDPVLGAKDCARYGPADNWDYTIVVTKSFIRMMTPEGRSVWQIPFEPAYPAYNGISVSFLWPTDRFAVWIRPRDGKSELLTHVVWLAEGKGILNSTNIPQNQYTMSEQLVDKVLGGVAPPASYFIAPALQDDLYQYRTLPWNEIKFSFAVALVCVAAGWGLGRRHYFSTGAQVKWAVFHLLCGLPGLVAMVCAQEWAARVPCPHCRKPRAVDRDRCVHCDAEFAPPAKTGTEIFETAGR